MIRIALKQKIAINKAGQNRNICNNNGNFFFAMSRLLEDSINKSPDCFGDLEVVFPVGNDGLRNTPVSCFKCLSKTECLRSAMSQGKPGIKAQEEYVDRAYRSGIIGFWTRWSKKKQLEKLRNII